MKEEIKKCIRCKRDWDDLIKENVFAYKYRYHSNDIILCDECAEIERNNPQAIVNLYLNMGKNSGFVDFDEYLNCNMEICTIGRYISQSNLFTCNKIKPVSKKWDYARNWYYEVKSTELICIFSDHLLFKFCIDCFDKYNLFLELKKALHRNNIKFAEVLSRTSCLFKMNYGFWVKPKDITKAKRIIDLTFEELDS